MKPTRFLLNWIFLTAVTALGSQEDFRVQDSSVLGSLQLYSGFGQRQIVLLVSTFLVSELECTWFIFKHVVFLREKLKQKLEGMGQAPDERQPSLEPRLPGRKMWSQPRRGTRSLATCKKIECIEEALVGGLDIWGTGHPPGKGSILWETGCQTRVLALSLPLRLSRIFSALGKTPQMDPSHVNVLRVPPTTTLGTTPSSFMLKNIVVSPLAHGLLILKIN